MVTIVINIAKEFSPVVGARYRTLGPYSGQAFYEDILEPRFDTAQREGKKLEVYLDGVRSYSESFLDESFGVLARKYGIDVVKDIIIFRHETKDWTVNYIYNNIWVPQV